MEGCGGGDEAARRRDGLMRAYLFVLSCSRVLVYYPRGLQMVQMQLQRVNGVV